MKSPVTNNDLNEPVAFNLMFATSISPTGLIKGFIRPETAQGMFVNFKRLLQFNQGKLPFAATQIGKPPIRQNIGDAVRSGLVNNETLGFFLESINSFLTRCGVKDINLKFRQP